MKRLVPVLVSWFLTLLVAVPILSAESLAHDLVLPHDTPVQVYFSPKGGAAQALVQEIGRAKESIFVQALIQAYQRGVRVEIILDKSQENDKRSGTAAVREAGIHTVIGRKHAIAHNKIMIIDQDTVVTGSFNFTKSAEEKNAENLLVVRSPELARMYLENWKGHWEHSWIGE